MYHIKTQDRHESANHVFKQIGVANKVSFFKVDKSPKGGMYGCFESHIQVIKDSYRRGDESVLIFEDDIFPTAVFSASLIQNGVDFMQRNTGEWDLFYYGYFVTNEYLDNIFKTTLVAPHVIQFRPNATHAYCISRKGMEKVLKMYQKFIGKVQIDGFLSSDVLGMQSFCMVPMLFEQILCLPHDNEAKKLTHHVFRHAACVGEKTKVQYILSMFVWLIQENKIALFVFLIGYVFTTLAIAMIFAYRRQKTI